MGPMYLETKDGLDKCAAYGGVHLDKGKMCVHLVDSTHFN